MTGRAPDVETRTAKQGRRRLPLDVDLAGRLLAEGRSVAAVARLLGVSRRTLSRHVGRAESGPEAALGILPMGTDATPTVTGTSGPPHISDDSEDEPRG